MYEVINILAPVVLFVYARPDHTKKTIRALEKNHLASETELIIYSDAAKKEVSLENVNEVRSYIDSLVSSTSFKSVKIIKAKYNNGLANSVIKGVSEVIDQYGKVIVLEDDLVSSPDFLQYMNDALDYYQNDDDVWSISGYSFKMNIPKNYQADTYLSYRGSSWGWATWKDRWIMVDWDVKDYPQFKTSKNLRKKMNRGGNDMSLMLDSQMNGEIDSWAIRWCYSQTKLDMFTIYPIVSRIKNIGLDGTGTHNSFLTPFFGSKYGVRFSDGSYNCNFEKPNIDKRILKLFKARYGNPIALSVKKYVKNILKK